MAKKTTIQDNTPALLEKPKATFKSELQQRIAEGRKLLERAVSNNDEYFKLKSDFDKWSDYNQELLKQSFNKADNEYLDSYYPAFYITSGSAFDRPSLAQLTGQVYNDINDKISRLEKLENKVDLMKVNPLMSGTPTVATGHPTDKSSVFIVHGHDELAKTEVARFIEKFGLKAVILHEQVNSGKTILEKIEEYTNVGFGIVLYTPCDLGAKKEEKDNLKPRARQNVVFEHGYLIAKLGRQNVVALVKGKGTVETPSDITGVVYVPMDNGGGWHYKLAMELKAAGYSLDLNALASN